MARPSVLRRAWRWFFHSDELTVEALLRIVRRRPRSGDPAE